MGRFLPGSGLDLFPVGLDEFIVGKSAQACHTCSSAAAARTPRSRVPVLCSLGSSSVRATRAISRGMARGVGQGQGSGSGRCPGVE